MYSLVRAIVLARPINSQWREDDIANIPVKQIFDLYTKVYLELSNNFLPANVYIDLDTLKVEFGNYNNILSQLFIDIGNRVLETVDSLPSTEVAVATYHDIYRLHYQALPVKIGYNVPKDYPENLMDDIELIRPVADTDFKLIHSNCLISVNGYYHMTATDGNRAFVYEAAKSLRKSRSNHIGMLNFTDIGKLTKIPIDIDNIYPENNTSTLHDKVYFDIPNVDLDNKCYILVLGGYLIFAQENIFFRNGTNSFVLDLNMLSYIERIYESSMYLDLSHLQLTTNAMNETMTNTAELWSDDVIKRYLTMSQSYLVIIDTERLITDKVYLRGNDFPGQFTSYFNPEWPLIINYGKIGEYWKTYEEGIWSVKVQDTLYRNYLIDENNVILENVNYDNLDPSHPYHRSKGFLLKIGGYKV